MNINTNKWTAQRVEALLKRNQNRLELNYGHSAKEKIEELQVASSNGKHLDINSIITRLVIDADHTQNNPKY